MNVLSRLRKWLNPLLLKKLVVVFAVAFIATFSDTITGGVGAAQPLSTSLLVAAAIGGLAAGIRALLALSPINLVPSDATHTLAVFQPHRTHPVLKTHGSFAGMKLGRGPVRHDRRTLRISRYLVGTLPKLPAAFDLSKKVKTWPMYGNDKLGDCTIAATGHMIQAWTAAASILKTIAEHAVELAYWMTGNPPAKTGHPGGPTDDGRVELDVLTYWRNTGIGGHRIKAFASVTPRNHLHMRAGIFVLGGLYVGIALPLTAQTQTVWDVVGDGKTGASAPGSWGGHAIDIVGYDSDGLIGITWGAPIRITWAFVDAYFEEAYAIVSRDYLNAKGKTPLGLDVAQLQADAAAITAS